MIIREDRLHDLPLARSELPGLQIIEIEGMLSEQDKGPAQQQAEIDPDINDQSVTVSGIACPLTPLDTQTELKLLLDKYLGKGKGEKAIKDGSVASVNWQHV